MSKVVEKSKLVSVVIPTLNSERFLEKCLKSIKEQSYSNIEVIVVDSHSKDGTREIAEKYGVQLVISGARIPRVRNIGASLAKGDFIFSVDSDMELTPNVVEECVAKIESGLDAVIIPESSIGEGFWAKCRALEKLCYREDDLIEAARFFKKDVFEGVNGYDIDLLFGEDWDLNQRIKQNGFNIGRVETLIRHNEGRLSIKEVMRKKHFYGKTLHRYLVKHRKEAQKQIAFIRPSFLKNWKKLARDPVHALGLAFMKTCELIAIYISA